MKAKHLALFSVLLAVALVLAACPAQPAAPAAQPPAAAEQPAAPGVINLQLMGWASSDAENVRLQEVVDGWNAANPDIQVTLNLVPDYDTKLQTSLAGGAPPDIFYVDSFRLPDLAAAGALLPIGDQMTNVDDFYPSLRDAFTVDGVFYCPPKDFSTLALEYNIDLFDAAGLAHPTADWTWEDLRAAAEALTDKDAGVVGFAINPDFARWIAFLYQAGGEVTTPDFSAMTLNTPEALTAMEFYVGLVRDGVAAPASDLDSGWPGEAFGKARAAMTMEGNWIVPYLKDQFPNLNYGVTELPSGPAGKATMAFTVCYGVAANGRNTEAATKVVDYLTGPVGMKAWTDLGLAMPTRQSLREGWLAMYPELEPFLNGAEYARKWQFRPGFADVLDTINSGLQEAFSGLKTPQQVLEEAQSVGEQVLAR
ncbi:ABC transporter substrate-binding protein [Caldilinea sp.]|jgi:multiple sugar transport system substrate-binding protein|uniref:ABC transporter substrate-binding protein n=1 Tax=Caldilinea sp. TaxID=2293560 RepID=UPI00261F4927|nr:ABC transporter substrate-binding protein [uncultured Caldilinea sp.]